MTFFPERIGPPRTLEELEAGMTNSCGLTRAQAMQWGLRWPLEKGWRKRLERQIRYRRKREKRLQPTGDIALEVLDQMATERGRPHDEWQGRWLSRGEHYIQAKEYIAKYGGPPWICRE